ncbi:ACT domain-containing protein [Aggregatilinea lenta]|uniref:ACT domain-containing protein n=1 Tax=Aggregatilinea lenta TaxID=913108 RepID=UPI0013C35605|nr:ACT domain-containing protein [Aggregatilinea lenta]
MDAAQALAHASLYTDDALYIPVHLPASAIVAAAGALAESATPFSALIADKDEVTLILPQSEWESFAHRLPDHRTAAPYRLITFDQPLEFELVGFMALVSRVLAGAGVSILAISAFERDHLLVPAAQFEAAWIALEAARNALPPGE